CARDVWGRGFDFW
nr:immunoglobulin heavy chain junction region [Macaca mulatta]MOX61751.1 immunoglobulin heavy chain junction region [Macaca mulatta]MOX62107.1 immunoglobulin heavy chain junction region [Macaca mulatta]MOX66136.1 immunoglobulin heavy chain junction region [Macaca mulatta]MOX66815.1 immunoglobulin heavy chain junction region [Macaca mulatta]